MAINGREKGAKGERELAKVLREYGYTEAKRGQQFCGINGNADVIDALPNIHIECKRAERLNIHEAMEQAKRDTKGKLPAVFHRKNRSKWLVTMELPDFMEIYKKYEERIKENGNGAT